VNKLELMPFGGNSLGLIPRGAPSQQWLSTRYNSHNLIPAASKAAHSLSSWSLPGQAPSGVTSTAPL
jgi:hypothetical protein